MQLIGNLLFLATIGLGAGAIVGCAYSLASGKPALAARIARGFALLIAFYGTVLLAASLSSRQRTLPLNEPVKFCGADCDLWMSVKAFRTAGTIGAVRAGGVFYIVQVTVKSDAARVTMKPDHPDVWLTDANGSRYAVSPEGQQALEREEGDAQPLARLVPPGGQYSKNLVFDVPAGATRVAAVVSEGGWMTRFVAGDENSFLHKKTLIPLS